MKVKSAIVLTLHLLTIISKNDGQGTEDAAAATTTTNNKGKIPLYLGGYFPMPGSSYDGSGFVPATQMALDHINERDDILAEYELMMIINDSGVSLNEFYVIYFLASHLNRLLSSINIAPILTHLFPKYHC